MSRKRKKLIRWAVFLLFVFGLGLYWGQKVIDDQGAVDESKDLFFTLSDSEREKILQEISHEKISQTIELPVVWRGGKILFTGNVFWARGINNIARNSTLGTAHPFAQLSEYQRGKYTDWVADLECPITEKNNLHNSYEESQLLKFNCDPDFLPEVAKYFSIFSLATNHTDNQGVDGFYETQIHLNNNQLQHFGHYDLKQQDEICKVLAVNFRQIQSDLTVVEGKIPMAFCGYHGVYRQIGENDLEPLKRFSEILPTIVMVHAGEEYQAEPAEWQRKIYRQMIEAGAEMVIGDHSHWVQPVEMYQGKLIAYSLGNFIFDQWFDQEVTQSAQLVADFELDDQAVKWSAILNDCLLGAESCSRAVGTNNLVKYRPEWSFDVVVSENRDKVTRLAGEEIRQKVWDRLGWPLVR